MSWNSLLLSTMTGTSNGPDAARPTNAATSIRGSGVGSGGRHVSNVMPGCATAVVIDRSRQLDALARKHQLFDRHVRALGGQ